ncbi:MAG: ATP-binding protein, partial [Curvibacter sp.]
SAVAVILWWALVWLVLLVDMRQALQREQQDAQRDLQSYTDSSAQALAATLRVLDLALLELRAAWQRDPQNFAQVAAHWRERVGLADSVDVAVVDRYGTVQFSSAYPTAVGLDVRDRPNFRHFASGAPDTLYVGEVVPSRRLQNRWFLPCSRPLFDAEGEFTGLVVFLVRPEYIGNLHASQSRGPAELVTLRGEDRRIVAQLQKGRLMLPAVQYPAPVPKPAALGSLSWPSLLPLPLPSASAQPPGPALGGLAWRELEGMGLSLEVRAAQNQLQSAIQAHRNRYLITGAVLSLLVLLLVYWRTRITAQAALSRRQLHLQNRKLTRSCQRLQQSRNQLRELHARELSARDEERRRLAQEVHDELGQQLTVLRMDISLLPRLFQTGGAPAVERELEQIKSHLDDALLVVRNIGTQLRPALLDVSLPAALEVMVDEITARCGLRCKLDTQIPRTLRLRDDVATAAFRIAQEALTNVTRHAQASQLVVTLAQEAHRLVLSVQDNGRGFDPALTDKASLGLSGMRERARSVGGRVEISSTPGIGTVVRASLPLAGLALASRVQTSAGKTVGGVCDGRR